MRHRPALRATLRATLAAHHLFDGVLDLALKLLHALVQAALAVLGYGTPEIAAALKGVDMEQPLEEIIRQALKKMVK